MGGAVAVAGVEAEAEVAATEEAEADRVEAVMSNVHVINCSSINALCGSL